MKYKLETQEFSEKYDSLIGKMESLTLDLTRLKLSNSHLKIQNNSLSADLDLINPQAIDKRVKAIYGDLENFKALTCAPGLCEYI